MLDLRDIIKRPLHNISATQFTTFLKCKRKWFFGWPLGLKTPQTDAQARGDRCHKSIEHRVLNGAIKDGDEFKRHIEALEQAYAYGMPLLPEMDEKPLIESWMKLPTVLGVPWTGKVDVLRPLIWPPTVQDWKSTSDIRYAATPDQVMRDPQTMSYAEWAYQVGHVPESSIIRVGLVYIEIRKKPLKKKLPKIVPVLRDTGREHVRSIWDGLKADIEEMGKIYQLDDPHEVPPNTAHCRDFGGCPHRERCGISMFTGVSSPGHTPSKPRTIKEIESMSFLANLNNGQNGQVSPQPAVAQPQTQAAPAPAAAPTAAPAAASPGGFLSQLGGATTTAPAPAAAPPAQAPTPAPVAAQAAGGGFLNNLAAPPPPAAAPVAAQPAPAPVAPQPPVAPPPGIVPPDAPPRETGAHEAQAAPADTGKKKRTTKKKGRSAGFTIYQDCAPMKGDTDTVLFDDWIFPLITEINKWAQTEKNVADQWLLGFADQKAAFSQGVQSLIGPEGKNLPAAIIVSSSSPFAREVLPLIIPHAAVVIRANKG